MKKITYILVGSILVVLLCFYIEHSPINTTDFSYVEKEGHWQETYTDFPAAPIDKLVAHMGGCIVFELEIGSEGKAKKIRVAKNMASKEFLLNANIAIRNWSWSPTSKNPNRLPAKIKKIFAYGSKKQITGLPRVC